jgi:hypothetical protein
MSHVFCTLSNDQLYTNYEAGAGGVSIAVEKVLINGGAGIANKRLITPLGVATEVNDNELKALHNNPDFLEHKKRGFIVVRDKKADPEKVATDMQQRDKSAPMTEADYQDENGPAVSTGARG